MIEVEVHQQLRAILREQGQPLWAHHLTVARLVARALRLGRSALMQMDPLSHSQGRHRLSYWVSLLMWPGPVILVVPEAVQQRLLRLEIPQLRQWTQSIKPIQASDRFPAADFHGICMTTPEAWWSDRLHQQGRFPAGIPTVFDSVDFLEPQVRQLLTVTLQPGDWQALMLACPLQADQIRDARVQLTQRVFQHPENPYEAVLASDPEIQPLRALFSHLRAADYPMSLPECWQQLEAALDQPHRFVWFEVLRRQGQFQLHCTPAEVASSLQSIWAQQPVVLLGSALDLDPEAAVYCQRLGLADLTCVKFASDRQEESIHLYLPERLPMPNTPEFQAALLGEFRKLLTRQIGGDFLRSEGGGVVVLLVPDVPLKARIGSILAAEFGSRVQVERTCLEENGILVSGWEFWQAYQSVLPSPGLLAIATLPIPTLEHPLVAGQVAYYKRQRQDWFRLYLLPTALMQLQRAIAPVRDRQGIVALFDTRVIHRSYGQQILTALQPFAQRSHWDREVLSELGLPHWE